MKTITVEEFVKEKVLPEHQEIVASLRQLMKRYAPDAKEVMSYGILAWRRRLIIAVLNPTKNGITFAFSRGADFKDKFGLLQGVGKVSKNVKLKKVSDINSTALRDYIRQAVELESK